MTESAIGLVLRVRPLTETSLIIHWLTPALGRIATVAKGARRASRRSLANWTCFISRFFLQPQPALGLAHAPRSRLARDGTRRSRGHSKLQQAGLRDGVHRTGDGKTETPLPAIYDCCAFLGLPFAGKNRAAARLCVWN